MGVFGGVSRTEQVSVDGHCRQGGGPSRVQQGPAEILMPSGLPGSWKGQSLISGITSLSSPRLHLRANQAELHLPFRHEPHGCSVSHWRISANLLRSLMRNLPSFVGLCISSKLLLPQQRQPQHEQLYIVVHGGLWSQPSRHCSKQNVLTASHKLGNLRMHRLEWFPFC